MPSKAIIIGAGFAGISAATCLAAKGLEVHILEKNATPGGRARSFESEGFSFDMGPSWYWMPDVFDKYFSRFGKKTSDYYSLIRLDPSYRVFWPDRSFIDIPANLQELHKLFESLEKGSSAQLTAFLAQAEYKYNVGINNLVYKPGQSVSEFFDKQLIYGLFKLDVFTSMHKHLRKFFKDEKILKLMEFPILFLGATAKDTPALYSLMNYADICHGTWYPSGGMYKIIEGMVKLAQEFGVKFHFNEEVTGMKKRGNNIYSIVTEKEIYDADWVIGGADYHHIEQNILPKEDRNYKETYWESRKMAPSSLVFYLGVNKKIKNLLHHNLFFDADFERHAQEIYKSPQWPTDPLFYVCCTSKTDDSSAPANCENVFILIPIAPGLEDEEDIRNLLFEMVLGRLEKLTGDFIRENIVYQRSYSIRDFKSDYNAYKGNAYGLANTLTQTANLKPSIKNKKIPNLYYTGQLTVPGPGVPPSLISGQLVADEILKIHHRNN